MKSGSFKGPQKKKKKKKKLQTLYKNFEIANFSNTLKGNLEKVNDNSYKVLEAYFLML